MNIRPPNSTELESIEVTRRAYRAMWSELKNVPDWRFDGRREDINALDFIDYEAGYHPEGIEGSAIIWAGVLAETGVLTWAVDDEQHLVLVGKDVYPKVLLLPYARVAEIKNSWIPQFGKYEWLLEEAILRLIRMGFSQEEDAKLLALLAPESEGFLDSAKRAIAQIDDRTL